jgi:hypothetical protein
MGPYFESGGPKSPSAPRKPRQGVKRARSVAPRRRSAFSASSIASGNFRRTAGVAKSRQPKTEQIRLPNVKMPDVGKAIGDTITRVVPQWNLFKEIGNKIENPSGRRSAVRARPSGSKSAAPRFTSPTKKATRATAPISKSPTKKVIRKRPSGYKLL